MISIIICSITPSRYTALCDNLGSLLGSEPHEFIGIHDAKSLAEAYNRGVRQSRGEVIITCHDDIEILSPHFKDRLLKRLTEFDLIGVAGSTRLAGARWFDAGPPYVFGQVGHKFADQPYYLLVIWSVPGRSVRKIKVMDGLFLAGRRSAFESIPFDEKTFTGFHLYDVDFTLRAYQAGLKLAVCTDFSLIHHSGGHYGDEWAADAQLFLAKHRKSIERAPGGWWRTMQVRVKTKEHALEILEPEHLPKD